MHCGFSNICKDKVNIWKELSQYFNQIHDAERVIF